MCRVFHSVERRHLKMKTVCSSNGQNIHYDMYTLIINSLAFLCHFHVHLAWSVSQLCLTLGNPLDYSPRLLCSWNFLGKQTGVNCRFLVQVIFLTQGSNLCLLQWQAGSLSVSLQGSPYRKWGIGILVGQWWNSRNETIILVSVNQYMPSCSVMSNSLQLHRLQLTRFLCPWGFSRQKYRSGLPCPPPPLSLISIILLLHDQLLELQSF